MSELKEQYKYELIIHIRKHSPVIDDIIVSGTDPNLIYECLQKDSIKDWNIFWYGCQVYKIPYTFAIKRFINEIAGIPNDFNLQVIFILISAWNDRVITNIEFKNCLKMSEQEALSFLSSKSTDSKYVL